MNNGMGRVRLHRHRRPTPDSSNAELVSRLIPDQTPPGRGPTRDAGCRTPHSQHVPQRATWATLSNVGYIVQRGLHCATWATLCCAELCCTVASCTFFTSAAEEAVEVVENADQTKSRRP